MSEVDNHSEKTGSTAQRVAGLLNLAGWLTGIWGIVYPSPYAICLAVLAALPVAAFGLLLIGRGTFTLSDPATPRRASLGGMLLLPALALGMRALFDDYLVDATQALMVTGGAAVLLTLLAAIIERRFTIKRTMIGLVLAFAWAWGGSVWLNTALDTGPARTIPVRVLNVTRFTPKTMSFTLYLSAWGPYPDGHQAEVTPALLRKTHVGDTVCVDIWPGRFGWQRYKVEACPLRP